MYTTKQTKNNFGILLALLMFCAFAFVAINNSFANADTDVSDSEKQSSENATEVSTTSDALLNSNIDDVNLDNDLYNNADTYVEATENVGNSGDVIYADSPTKVSFIMGDNLQWSDQSTEKVKTEDFYLCYEPWPDRESSNSPIWNKEGTTFYNVSYVGNNCDPLYITVNKNTNKGHVYWYLGADPGYKDIGEFTSNYNNGDPWKTTFFPKFKYKPSLKSADWISSSPYGDNEYGKTDLQRAGWSKTFEDDGKIDNESVTVDTNEGIVIRFTASDDVINTDFYNLEFGTNISYEYSDSMLYEWDSGKSKVAKITDTIDQDAEFTITKKKNSGGVYFYFIDSKKPVGSTYAGNYHFYYGLSSWYMQSHDLSDIMLKYTTYDENKKEEVSGYVPIGVDKGSFSLQSGADYEIVKVPDEGSNISGKITDKEGHAINGVKVTLSSADNPCLEEVFTDENGNYKFTNPDEEGSAQGYKMGQFLTITAQVKSHDDVWYNVVNDENFITDNNVFDYELDSTVGVIEGFIQDASGNRVVNTNIDVYKNDTKLSGTYTTDGQGYFTVDTDSVSDDDEYYIAIPGDNNQYYLEKTSIGHALCYNYITAPFIASRKLNFKFSFDSSLGNLYDKDGKPVQADFNAVMLENKMDISTDDNKITINTGLNEEPYEFNAEPTNIGEFMRFEFGAYSEQNGVQITSDTTCKVVFEEKEAWLQYKTNGENKGSVTRSDEDVKCSTGYASGSTATAKSNYHFVNWTDSKGNIVSENAEFVPVKNPDTNIYEDEIYTANFEEDQVQINYVAAENGTVDIDSEMVDVFSGVPKGSTAIADAGYAFEAWTDENGKVVSVEEHFVPEPDETTEMFSAHTYTAHFQYHLATLNYVAGDGGKVSLDTETIDIIDGIPEGSLATADEGYVFVNWTDKFGNVVSQDSKLVPEKYLEEEGAIFIDNTYTANFELSPVPDNPDEPGDNIEAASTGDAIPFAAFAGVFAVSLAVVLRKKIEK